MLRSVLALWILPSVALAAQTVDGRVVNSANGAGISGVNVILGGGSEGPYRATTDAEGRFHIDGLEDGAYFPFYHARGFWTIPFSLDPRGLPPISVTAKGGPVHLEVRMQPVPKLSGRVLDSNGKPVPNATVWALENARGCSEPSCFGLRSQSKTDDKGEYTVASFDTPGTWLVSAIGPPTLEPPASADDRALGWAQTFYPGVADPQLAARVQVSAADVWNVDVKLAAVPVYRIRGKLLDAHGDPASKVAVALSNGLGSGLYQDSGDDGVFEFGTVPDGEWQLSAMADRERTKLWTSESVLVKDRDTDKIELRLAAPFTVHGTIAWQAPEGVPAPERPPDVVLARKGGNLDSAGAPRTPVGRPDEEGGMTFEGVYPGQYEVAFLEPPPAPFYLASVRLGGRDAPANEVAIVGGEQALAIVFQYGGGTVRGTIEGCGEARVVLLPQDPSLRRSAFVRDAACGPNGQFEFAGVRPGEYYGLAFQGNGTQWSSALHNDAVLQQAAKVTVRANEHTTAEIRVVK